VRPQAINEGAIRGAFEVRVRQHDEQRCGIGGAVVLAKRDFAECCHLAAPHLMQNFAGLRVLRVRDRRRLRLTEKREYAPSHIGRGPKQLHRRDDAIAAERCAEPRNPRVRIWAVRRVGDHHRQVR
jgi:hypothetical protein